MTECFLHTYPRTIDANLWEIYFCEDCGEPATYLYAPPFARPIAHRAKRYGTGNYYKISWWNVITLIKLFFKYDEVDNMFRRQFDMATR